MDCKKCDKTINCINGKFCTVLKKYVEYKQQNEYCNEK